jgi:hypothetical protein
MIPLIIKHWECLKYLAIHKYHVYVEGRKLRVGRLQLLIHDWSKILPSEWFAYANFFHSGNEKYKNKDTFNIAWNHHQKRNKHHWEYWVKIGFKGTECLPMPLKYIKEMVADWTGAGMAIHGRNEVVEWYTENRNKMLLHQNTRIVVEHLLGVKNA